MKILISAIFSLLLFSCGNAQSFSFSKYGDKAPSHDIWDGLVKKHVSPTGIVNYKGFIADSVSLNKYLDMLSAGAPDPKKWSKNDQIAFWINAYNAYTVKLIIRNYPLKGIKEIGGRIPFINSTWDIKFFSIGGTEMDLNNIEHGILRKDFEEPRIHFAVNCASVSCPKLRNEAYVGSRLDAQLNDQAKAFLADKGKNNIKNANEAKLSKLFKWFKGDFTKNGDLISFINKYSTVKLNKDANLDFLDYDWNLNE